MERAVCPRRWRGPHVGLSMTQNGHFTLPRRVAKLVFTGEYEGAEVRVRLDVPLATYFEVLETRGREGYAVFVETAVVDWNLQDEAGGIPATPVGAERVSPGFLSWMILKWIAEVAQVPDPLGTKS